MDKNYCIKEGYISRKEYNQNVQIESDDQFQDEVYNTARQVLDHHNYKSVLDIGCGSGYKLIKYFRDSRFTGLDLEPNLTWLKETYPHFDFRLSDFNNPPKEQYDIVICSDVIEHILDPDQMIDFINGLDFERLIISTPDRGLIQALQKSWGWSVEENGPPANVHHTREWTAKEFAEYISQTFDIEWHAIAPKQVECQIMITKKRKE